jgi:hypothetical protein
MCPGRDSNPYAFRPRGLSSPIPHPLAFVVVHLRLLLRVAHLSGRLRIPYELQLRFQLRALRCELDAEGSTGVLRA